MRTHRKYLLHVARFHDSFLYFLHFLKLTQNNEAGRIQKEPIVHFVNQQAPSLIYFFRTVSASVNWQAINLLLPHTDYTGAAGAM